MLKPENIGENLSIDETSLHDDLFTFLSNKAGHCRQGTIVAAVRGTRAEDVIGILLQIPEEDRLAVKEVTLDLSSSMKDIVSTVFPNATIVLDCFHVLKRCHDAVEELRLRTKREAQVDVRPASSRKGRNTMPPTGSGTERLIRRTTPVRSEARNPGGRTRSSSLQC